MHALSDGTQALRSVVHSVHRRHNRQQTLGGADVRRGFVPANVLFPGLQSHAQGGLAQPVDGDSNDSAWEMALEAFAGGKKRGMRPPVTHRHPKPLRTSHHHISTHGAGAFQHQQCHQIGRENSPNFAFGHVGHKSRQVLHLTIGIGVLDHAPKDIACLHGTSHGFTTHDHHVNVEVRRARAENTECLRKHRFIHQEPRLASLHLGARAGCKQHRHGFRCRRALVEQRGVGHFHPGQVHDHGLEIEKRFQTALGNFSLIRRVSRVPPWILKHIATNDAWHFRGVVAHPNVVAEHRVLGGEAVDVLEVLAFRQRLRHAQTFAQPDGSGNGAFNEVVE